MTTDVSNEPQVQDIADAADPVTVESQVPGTPADAAPALPAAPVTPEPSLEEIRQENARLSTEREAVQRRAEQAEGAIFRLNMEREMREAAITEAQAHDADLQQVEAGELTPQQARQNINERQAAIQQERTERFTRQERAATEAQARSHTNEGLRLLAAKEIADDFGVDVREILKVNDRGNVALLRAKASELKMANLEKKLAAFVAAAPGSEVYDASVGGPSGPPNLSGMTPRQKAEVAYGPEATARRNNRR